MFCKTCAREVEGAYHTHAFDARVKQVKQHIYDGNVGHHHSRKKNGY